MKRILPCFIFCIACSMFLTVNAQTSVDSTGQKNVTLKEVVVTGTRTETDPRYLPMSITEISKPQISKSYEQSLLPILNEHVPGFFSTSRSIMGYGVSSGAAGEMSIRGIGGSPTTRVLVLIDGHPQYMGIMGHPIPDVYQSMLAEKVEIIRGPASFLYGSNAMGGVMNIVTSKQKENGIKNSVRVSYGSYNTLASEIANRVREGKFSSTVTASYNRTDGHRDNMDFEQYGGYAKFGYELSGEWSVFTDINLTHFNASNPGSLDRLLIDNDSRITRGATSVTIKNDFESSSGALTFFYNWGSHEINDGYSPSEEALDYLFRSDDKMLGTNLYQSISLFSGNTTTVGFDYQHFGGKAWNKYTNSEKILGDHNIDEVSGYIGFRQSVGARWTFDVGGRVDHHSQTGTEWIPQVGLSYFLSSTAELKAIVSKGFRNPTIRELYMFRSSNSDLLPEKLINYEISYSQHLTNFVYGINLFYINGENLIKTVFANGRPLNINTGKIENWGAEVNVNYKINSRWSAFANYSWLKMEYPVLAAPQHKLYCSLNYSREKWNLSTGLQYVAGLYTSIAPDKEEDYILWNVRGSYQFCSFAEVFIRGENLLGQEYEINLGYPMPKATILGGISLNF